MQNAKRDKEEKISIPNWQQHGDNCIDSFFMTCLHFSVNIVIPSLFFFFFFGILIDTDIPFISLRMRKKCWNWEDFVFFCSAHFPLHLILCRHFALLTYFRFACLKLSKDHFKDFIYFLAQKRFAWYFCLLECVL